MPNITQDMLDEMVSVIVQTVDPEQIILFGSQARRDGTLGSDVDFLIIESEPFDKRSRRKEMAKIWRKLSSYRIPKDILVYSRNEVEYWRDSINNIVGRALREGKVLYERS
ncbi:nucleotidyltransferase domain-containing protein [Thermodesulfobacteriota bacterium]